MIFVIIKHNQKFDEKVPPPIKLDIMRGNISSGGGGSCRSVHPPPFFLSKIAKINQN